VSALRAKIIAARAVGELARRAGRGGGTSLPGRMLTVLEPDAIALLASRLTRGSAIISATNGKTTTAAIAASILSRAGVALVHNRAGANMPGGIAAALLEAATSDGSIRGELGLFEVDEAWLEPLAGELRPRALLLGNLFRDQLDRYGELEVIADRWVAALAQLPAGAKLVLNADDPLVADLCRESSRARYFGIEDRSVGLSALQHASDSKHCRRCGAPYRYEAIYLGHLGSYSCPSCGQLRPEPQVRAEAIELEGVRGSRFTLLTPAGEVRVALALPGLYNVYNALGAASLCLELGVGLEQVAAGIAAAGAAFGRGETLELAGRRLSLLLIKNPAGANEVIRTLALEDGELELLVVLNDRIADGRDVSWIWDADFELLAERIARAVCAGTRAAELALRLKYAGVPVRRLRIEPQLPAALDAALASGTSRPLYALPTYTALLELREALARRGLLAPYWAHAAAGTPAREEAQAV
jgi:UDP-N-acetylmuramyl tripeptide synthase